MSPYGVGEGTALWVAWGLISPWIAGALGAWLLASWVCVYRRYVRSVSTAVGHSGRGGSGSMSANAGAFIELRHVTCCRGSASVLDASLSISAASFHSLRGDAGASLLLRMATLLEIPDDGVVRLAGKAVHEIDETARATVRSRVFGFVFDAPFLLPEMSVAENIAMPLFKVLDLSAKEAGERTEQTLRFAGLEPLSTTRAGELSWFDQQRVALSRAIAHQPTCSRLITPMQIFQPATPLSCCSWRAVSGPNLGIGVLAVCAHPVEPHVEEHWISVMDGCVREETGAIFETPEQTS
jgi:lipoprotein-releasing system ATP-binding protein